jgi:pantoate--beta-alanine ligase
VIERVSSIEEVRQAVSSARRENKTVGFVPTMGALHQGHVSLVKAACRRTEFTVVSIFVNPTQFGPGEDFERYPRDLEHDLDLLAAEGVDLVFTPSVEVMCGAESDRVNRVSIDPGPLGEIWEGASRPGHFRGVATVVGMLLNVVRPDLAFLGEKDYQQLVIVRRLVADLDFRAGIVGCPIVRDHDGLALSSRNAYLSAEERQQALSLSRALDAAAEALAWDECSGAALTQVMEAVVASSADVELDYAAVVDPETLEPVNTVEHSARAIIAARVGATRLIDNCELRPQPVPATVESDIVGGPNCDSDVAAKGT